MKFIVIDKSAAVELVSMRQLQSTDYESGLSLAAMLVDGIESDLLFDRVGAVQVKDGIALVTDEPDFDSQLIIDLEYFTGFANSSPADVLSIFQKTCRVALKYWEKIPFTGREWFIAENDLVVLITKKYSIGGGAKVLIDVKPDWGRQERRNTHHLLAFHYGTEDVNKKPSTTNFRKAIVQIKDARVDRGSTDDDEGVLRVETLGEAFKPIDSNTSFETWRNLLTTSQSSFVFRNDHGPERIEGAAGTGKTLSLALRCCNVLNVAKNNKQSLKVAFVTHSHASKEYIENIIFPKLGWYDQPQNQFKIELITVTLQEWCISSLGNKIENTELLDKDAQGSKDYQQILISDVLERFKQDHIDSHAKFISPELLDFLSGSDLQSQVQSLQYEIAEMIKGRSGQDLEKYKKTIDVSHSLPLNCVADYECIFGLYSSYQKKLEATGYFDSDDVILSALSQLESPIWRRRKNSEGFDVLFVDETHLFNLNELSVMHHLLKDDCISNIIYSIDRSQSLANISLETKQLDEVFGNDQNVEVNLKTIFRSSPDIIRLAFSILSSGSTLFTNMENPLDKVQDSFTSEDEKRSKKPYCLEFSSDEEVVAGAFGAADRLAQETGSKKCRIIIIASTETVLMRLERYAADHNKPSQFIKQRGDKKSQIEAEKGNKYILSGIDYVGGLEFDGAVIVGGDKGHMPATEENVIDAKHFLNHAAYNRMYVAVTRAKYGVSVLYSAARGVSSILEHSIKDQVIDVIKE